MTCGISRLMNIFLLHTHTVCKLMTLAINMLNNILLLHTKTQTYHLKYPNYATPNVIM